MAKDKPDQPEEVMKPFGYKGPDGKITDEGMYELDEEWLDKVWEEELAKG